jgi:5,10-methenyltetrahydromethanopterin hydrogenase
MARSKAEANGSSHNMMDLVREALNELGDASPKAIQKFIHEKHGVDMKTTMISSYKSNIAKKEGIATGKGAEGASVSVKDIATIRNLIERLGTGQLMVLVKVLSK